ncbi:hypothetical protein [Streptomyces bobili]|uniref:hypothetical protein n=1 Tax=Streptomyces bobili TaxID=67280 RepID=UPI0037169D8D
MTEKTTSVPLQDLQLAVAHLVSHPRFFDVASDPERLSSANEDPREYLNEKGFQLPPEWTVKFSKDSALSMSVCVNGFCMTVSLEV